MRIEIDRAVPRWALPLHKPVRYKGAKGGRGSGKSHEFAAMAVEDMVCDPGLRFVCIREVQRTLRYSAKSLVESKIRELGVSEHFDILQNEIRRKGGTGVMTFEGMQDHTADSIKSLEGFRRAWVEEAQTLSKRSLDLLLPTIRAKGSQIWFSWNPEDKGDRVDLHFQELAGADFMLGPGTALGDGYALVHVNYLQNPFLAEEAPEALEEAERMRALDTDAYEHIWLGGYNEKSDSKVLAGKYVVEDFDVPMKLEITRRGERVMRPTWDGPYFGCDHGFAQDPRVLVKCWIGPHGRWGQRCLYVEKESYHVKLDIDETAERWASDMGFSDVDGWPYPHDDFTKHAVRAEGAEPGTNNYLRRNGVPRIEDVKKWQGSVHDGVTFLKSFDKIVIHTACPNAHQEARLYSYKVDKHTGDIKPDIEDKHNHVWDAVRYALAPLIKPGPSAHWRSR